jgi:pyridoxine 4-dehydrogenase
MTQVAEKDRMANLDARKSGTFKVGGEILVHRFGFGAMRVTGPGIWGAPCRPR